MRLTILLLILVARPFISGLLEGHRDQVNFVGMAALLVVVLWPKLSAERGPTIELLKHPLLVFVSWVWLTGSLSLFRHQDGQMRIVVSEMVRAASYSVFFLATASAVARMTRNEFERVQQRSLLIVGLFLVAYSLHGIVDYYFGGGYIVEPGWEMRARLAVGLAVNPNAFAASLAVGGAAVLFARDRSVGRAFRVVVSALVFWALLLAGARFVIVAALVGTAYAVWKRWRVAGFASYAIAGLVVLGASQELQLWSKGNSSLEWRIQTWLALLQSMSPLEFAVGVGPGKVTAFLAAFSPLDVTEPHNDIIRLVYSFGVPGLLYYTICLRPRPFSRWGEARSDGLNVVAVVLVAASIGENLYRDSNATLLAMYWLAMRAGVGRIRLEEAGRCSTS